MGEAILVKAGGLGGNGGTIDPEDQNIVDWQLKTELITNSKEFIVPKAKNQQFSVRLFGAGGTGPLLSSMMYGPSNSYGKIPGASGNMNFGQFKLNRGDIVPIVIGTGGNGFTNESVRAGGTTSFGNYLSATGGGIADYINGKGADGGVGSPAIICINGSIRNMQGLWFMPVDIKFKINAGKSYYGGGSGGCSVSYDDINVRLKGADGGTYGGGGGSPGTLPGGNGGNGCGKGGNNSINATNGTNTMPTVLNNFSGYGIGGGKCGGGGGYGGEGSISVNSSKFDGSTGTTNIICCGGGGGYGNANTPEYCLPDTLNLHLYSKPTSGVEVFTYGRFGGGYGNAFGGYGKEGYGMGATQIIGESFSTVLSNRYSARDGVCILSYYTPVYNNG